MTKHPLEGARGVSHARSLFSSFERTFMRSYCATRIRPFRGTERAIAVMTSQETRRPVGERRKIAADRHRASLRTQTIRNDRRYVIDTYRSRERKDESVLPAYLSLDTWRRCDKIAVSAFLRRATHHRARARSVKNHPHRRVTGEGSTSRSGPWRPLRKWRERISS